MREPRDDDEARCANAQQRWFPLRRDQCRSNHRGSTGWCLYQRGYSHLLGERRRSLGINAKNRSPVHATVNLVSGCAIPRRIVTNKPQECRTVSLWHSSLIEIVIVRAEQDGGGILMRRKVSGKQRMFLPTLRLPLPEPAPVQRTFCP